jgi:hypothetical protein
MTLDEMSLLEQLTRILADLELEFRDIVGDANAPDDLIVPGLELAAERIDFAAFCIVAAKRALVNGHSPHRGRVGPPVP